MVKGMNFELVFSMGIAITIIVALPTCNQSGSNYHEDLKSALHAEYKAHMEKNALALVATFSDSFVSVDKGRIGFPGREESLKRFESYFDKVNFIEWSDVTPPVIRFSNDKSLAYVIVRKQVILEIKSNPGTYDTTHFAWTGIYRQENKTWKLECITSTNE